MSKFHEGIKNDTEVQYFFDCPGCKTMHHIRTLGPNPTWHFNGDLEKPTVSPSILVRLEDGENKHVCHSFVKNGQIQFLDDSTHELAGQTVELKDFE